MRSKRRQLDLDNLNKVANVSGTVNGDYSFLLGVAVLVTQFAQSEKSTPRGFLIGYADFGYIGTNFGEIYLREVIYSSHDCTLLPGCPYRFGSRGKKVRILTAQNAELYAAQFREFDTRYNIKKEK